MKFPFLSVENIEGAANEVVSRTFGSRAQAGARVDLDAIVYDYLSEQEDLSFDDEAELGQEDGEEVLGKTLPFAKKILIHKGLRSERKLGRYRFTVAHEIGHWVLHRPHILKAVEPKTNSPPFELASLKRCVFPQSTSTRIPTEEWQANRFAAYLLIDQQRLSAEFLRRFGRPPVPWRDEDGHIRLPSLRTHARGFATRVVRRKASLCDLFDVSADAMAVTLLERSFVTSQ